MPQVQPKTDAASIVGLDMSYVLTNDPPKAIAFYRDVLGMIPTDFDEEGRGAEFELADGSTFGVWHDKDTKAPGAGTMLAVPDIHAAIARFRERGLSIADPIETPVCYMAFSADPDGNPLMIHQRKTTA